MTLHQLLSSFVCRTQRRPVSPEVDEKCQKILQRIAQHYEYHGISIKSCYEDFDRHNIGTITESQVIILTLNLSLIESSWKPIQKHCNKGGFGVLEPLKPRPKLTKTRKQTSKPWNCTSQQKFSIFVSNLRLFPTFSCSLTLCAFFQAFESIQKMVFNFS